MSMWHCMNRAQAVCVPSERPFARYAVLFEHESLFVMLESGWRLELCCNACEAVGDPQLSHDANILFMTLLCADDNSPWDLGKTHSISRRLEIGVRCRLELFRMRVRYQCHQHSMKNRPGKSIGHCRCWLARGGALSLSQIRLQHATSFFQYFHSSSYKPQTLERCTYGPGDSSSQWDTTFLKLHTWFESKVAHEILSDCSHSRQIHASSSAATCLPDVLRSSDIPNKAVASGTDRIVLYTLQPVAKERPPPSTCMIELIVWWQDKTVVPSLVQVCVSS